MKQITKDTVLKQGDKSFEQFLAENPYKHTRSFTEADWEADRYEKWKETIKIYTAIETEQGIVWIDKDAELLSDDNYYSLFHKQIMKVVNEVHAKVLNNLNKNQFNTLKEIDFNYKIIAANFELEGVPKIELEDDEVYTIEDLKESSIHFCDAYINSPSTVANKDLREVWELFKNSCLSWVKNRRIKKGYKANQAKYTEEDMINCVVEYNKYIQTLKNGIPNFSEWLSHEGKNYLQSLNSIKEITVDENFKPI